jgi:hypothetical protein
VARGWTLGVEPSYEEAEMQNRKTIVMIAGVIVAAGVGFLAWRGAVPSRDGTEGAIGAAKRYQSQQIGDQDVTLDDAQVATFIQSDSFRKLATDPKFREAARSESFGRVVENNSIREVSARVDLGEVLQHAAIQDLLKSPEFAKAVESGHMKELALKSPDLFTVTESAHLKNMLNAKGVSELARNAEFLNLAAEYIRRIEAAQGSMDAAHGTDAARTVDEARTMDAARGTDAARVMDEARKAEAAHATDAARTVDEARKVEAAHATDAARSLDEARKLEAARGTDAARSLDEARRVEAARGMEGRQVTEQFAMAEFSRLLDANASLRSLEGIRSLEGNKHLPEALSKGFMDLFANRDVAAFAVDGMRKILDQQSYLDALKMDGFSQLMEGLTVDNLAAVRDVASSPEMLSVLSNATYREAAKHAELSMAASAGLEAAVQRIPE